MRGNMKHHAFYSSFILLHLLFSARCDCESLPPSCQGGKVDDFQIKTGTGQIVDSIETLRRMNKQVLSFNMDQGVACWNKDQIDSHCTDWMFMDQFQGGPPCCDDYTVRYCCTEGGVQTPEMVRKHDSYSRSTIYYRKWFLSILSSI